MSVRTKEIKYPNPKCPFNVLANTGFNKLRLIIYSLCITDQYNISKINKLKGYSKKKQARFY